MILEGSELRGKRILPLTNRARVCAGEEMVGLMY